MTTTLYKVGGSLLSLSNLGARLNRLLEREPDSRPLFVVGGGSAADLVRDWDRLHQLGEERAHWLALQSMMLNEALLLELLPNSRRVSNRVEAEQVWSENQRPILTASEFLRSEEPGCGDVLPHTWNVTSDSIAAWITRQWPADRLVLLKSVPPPSIGNSAIVESPQPVDANFGSLAAQLPNIAWVNLRSTRPEIQAWIP